jgi:hypothetical protein
MFKDNKDEVDPNESADFGKVNQEDEEVPITGEQKKLMAIFIFSMAVS